MTSLATEEKSITRPDFSENSVRTRILYVGARLIAEHGIAGMSMRQLATESGFSTGTINYHFQNKRKLSIAILEFVYRLPVGWSGTDGAQVNLPKLVATFILHTEGRRTWWKFWMRYSAEATGDPELRDHQVKRMERQEAFYAKTIQGSIDRGEIAPAVPAEDAAREILAVAHGLAVTQVIDGTQESVDRAQATIDAALEAILRPVNGSTANGQGVLPS